MNDWLLFACMTVLPYIAGRGMLVILYRKQPGKVPIADCVILGWLVAIGLAEAAHLAAVFLGWQFSIATGFMAVAFAAVVCVCMVLLLMEHKLVAGKYSGRNRNGVHNNRKQRESGGNEITPLRFGLFMAFVFPVIFQILTIMSQDSVYRMGDMTVETVESFLETNAVYAVNPLTGRAYEAGIPLRIMILGLPTLYGALCSIFDIAGTDLVWKYIPLIVLLLSYGAYTLIAGALFDGEKEKDKRLLFMVFVALVFCVGDYAYGMDGFNIMHCGFRGVVIRNMVLVPYAFGLALRRKWRPAMAVVLAEACITWTFYGLGVCVVVLAGMAVVRGRQLRRAGKHLQTTGFRDKREEA